MKKNYTGLDVLRGLGIFILLIMHTAFYHFKGLYDLDLNNPPPIVTVIGLMLMFAGIFAMISGIAHTTQYLRKRRQLGYSHRKLWRYNTYAALSLLLVAYLYFIFTGPGIVDMANRSMNNSILVQWINTGMLAGTNMERVWYIDSLVMLGTNVFLMGAVFILVEKKYKKIINPSVYLYLALGFFVLSLIRIPLYPVYLNAYEAKDWLILSILNPLVSKNNPIFPYFSFALMGMWIAMLLAQKDWKMLVRKVVPIGTILFVGGIIAYIFLPDTMLQRGIDPIWFAIMTAQLGLFQLLICLALWYYDIRDTKAKVKPISKFIARFGVAGLSIFFIESVFSAIIARILRSLIPGFSLDIVGSLLFGLCLAVFWGFFLIFWEKAHYKYGIEYSITRILHKYGKSEKQEKLEGKQS
ncbi:MAG: hypothetical protein E4G74_02360 [Erysipelotrichales bacterium]|nr:MAG: hypothetical protein E4G74_02360 [Erysipelotrichales bacterium]